MPKILIVEDEEITAFALELFCENLGYTVLDTVNNYEEALHLIHHEHPDLIISDIELNDTKNGLDIALEAQEKYGIPTIFLTAYYNEEILKQAKNIHFYGYIVKPYKEKELEATLKLALYQNNKEKKATTRYVDICDYVFDMKTSTLYNDILEINLSKKSKRLLYFLALHQGELKTYSEIIDYVYEGEEKTLDSLRHIIKRLRQNIGESCIKASRNIGYTLEKPKIAAMF